MSALDHDLELEDLKRRSVDRLLMADVFDRSAFKSLLKALDERAMTLKEEYVVPKQFISYLRGASQAIRTRAEYLPEVKGALDLADKFDLLLDLSIMGESLGDRQPGVPRII